MIRQSEGVEAAIRLAGGGPERRMVVGRIINCSGPLAELSRVASPLLRGLIDAGQIRPDPLDLGLDVTAEGAAIGRDGRVSHNLFALGPLTKGIFWETTAVPDIRVQCERLATQILANTRATATARQPETTPA